jgi:hypothetical protein
MRKTIGFTLWKEQAEAVEEALGIIMVGDTATINRAIVFTVESAEGRHKVRVEFDV